MAVGSEAYETSIDPAEVAKFERMAAEWWDADGKFRPLHKLNPVRLGYIRDHAAEHFHRDAKGGKPLAGLRVLDIGCGGGLLTEPMARLGADVRRAPTPPAPISKPQRATRSKAACRSTIARRRRSRWPRRARPSTWCSPWR